MSPLLRSSCLPFALVAVAWPAAATTPAAAKTTGPAVEERSAAISSVRTFRLAQRPTHIALHWTAAAGADVDVALSRDGRRFGRRRHVELDEAGRRARPGETYGKMMLARSVRALRVRSDRPLRRLTVLAISDKQPKRRLAGAAGHADTPAVISRREWGADETLRFGGDGRELWPPAFSPVQKLVVHHTAGENRDPDPAATIRAVYYYHAVTQGWGDIGYNFLIDAEGRLYEGRYSAGASTDAAALPDATPGEDDAARGVTAAHAYGYNSGTVGVALLGNLNAEDARPAARETLERFLAWEAERHRLDPRGEGLYTNPVTGAARSLPNVAAHRDALATDCPGAVLYATLPRLRDAVARRLSAIPLDPPAPGPSPESPLPSADASPGRDITRPHPVPDRPPTPHVTPPEDGSDPRSPAEPTGDRTAPRARGTQFRIRSASLRGDRRGRVRVRVACASPGGRACFGSIALIASPRVAGLKAMLVRHSIRLRPRSTRTLMLRLPRRTTRVLRARDRTRVVVRMTARGGAGGARSTQRVLRLSMS